MIESILPAGVATVWTTLDLPGDLFAVEQVVIDNAVDKRRREFETGRACARMALERLGLPRTAIAAGDRGQPLWPDGIVGSITHCDGYRACAAARRGDVATLGIDAEPHAALPARVLCGIATNGELRRLAAASPAALHLDRILFSAKESVFKAWSPCTDRRLGFKDCDIVFDTGTASFCARLAGRGPILAGRERAELQGRWCVADGVVVTAVVVDAARPDG